MVTPTTNVCDGDADHLDLVMGMHNYSVVFWLEIVPESFSEDLKFSERGCPQIFLHCCAV